MEAGGEAGTGSATWKPMPDMVSRPKGHSCSCWWVWGSGGLAKVDPGVEAWLGRGGVGKASLDQLGEVDPGVVAWLGRGGGGRAP